MPEQRPIYEPWTPLRCEEEINGLSNALARAEIELRKLRIVQADAKWEYERAQTIAAFDDNCPVPTRGGSTVGEREAFIKGCCDDELKGLIYHSVNVTNAEEYMRTLRDRLSATQTTARLVLVHYNVTASRGEGGY